MLDYRLANLGDLTAVSRFTDFWLSGRGRRVNAPGAVNDYFISRSQHRKYIVKYSTWICLEENQVVCWAVVEPSGTLISLLVAGDCRGHGIGTKMMELIRPKYVRSKSDQSSGNPIGFYESLGFKKLTRVKSRSRLDIDKLRPLRKPNIDVLTK